MEKGVLGVGASSRGRSAWQVVRTPTVVLAVTRGGLSISPHHLTVARIGHERMILTSEEPGGLIRSRVHDIVDLQELEFWQGRPSWLHDRFRACRAGARWQVVRLQP